MKGDDLKRWSKNALVREVQKLRALLAQQMEAAPGTGTTVEVHGIVSSTTREPIVTMRAGEAAWQMTPAQARQHALIILDAAVECERDAATIAFLDSMSDGDGIEETTAAFLTAMRDHRKDWLNEFREPWDHHATPDGDA